ncbi:DUF2304 domain-containing protein [Carboxydocella sp. ULO1]|uniref:DUF2304 domain-containing protein n=1 Tax=Carboxydocella sp. ULO1 TaxID=1926599 RepID=UPI0009ADCAAF|nr:DUF2304 domain-containing protein [Carboxydocella sp. ULO1]GAW29470.1 hypothetical protein ULO1_20400 [Carboxydocella sp. ULO1]
MKNILIFSFTISVIFMIIIFDLIRKKLLKEQYALLWLFFGSIMIILSTNSVWLDFMARVLNVMYPPSLLFLFGILVCLFLILHLSLVVSRQSERIVRLTQEIGILRHEIEKRKDG